MQRRQRGFTLIELLMAVAVSSIVGVTFFGVMFMQTLSYVERLDELDSHSNARAALNVMRRYVHNARWGMVSNPNGAGTIGIGKCYLDSNPSQSNGSCNNLPTDGGADRMRVTYIVNDSEYVSTQTYGSAANCSTGSADTISLIHVNQNPVNVFTNGTVLGIGGNCLAGSANSAASDVLVFTSDSGSGAGCGHRYGYSMLEGSAMNCSAGYSAGYSFGRAVVADFFIAKDGAGNPQLRMRTNPTQPIANAYIVSYDIEDLQVSYGIDTSYPSDRAVDVWCDDPRTTSGGGNGSCDTHQPTGPAYSTADNYNRIIAVRVSLRVRTDSTRPNIMPFPINPNLTVSNPIANVHDGYQRWLYTATIALRNDNI